MPSSHPPDTGVQVPELSEHTRKQLRGRAHALRPLIRIGSAGVSAELQAETLRALERHELIKVKAAADHRAAREALFAQLAAATGSVLLQRIGHVAVLYRPRVPPPRTAD
jgi:RNA-binding protein